MKFSPCLLLLLLLACGAPSEDVNKNPQAPKPPNILFLFTDDQTYRAVHALGNTAIQTPNMDRLIGNGTTFTHAYNMGAWNGAVCLASRAMIVSGRSLWRANRFRQGWQQGDSLALAQSWGKLMEQQGYDTYMSGKWHVDAPAAKVFQQVSHVRPGMPGDQWDHETMVRRFAEEVDGKKVKAADVMPVGYNRPLNETDDSWSPSDSAFGGFWEGGQHWSEVLRDDAVSFLQQAKQSSNPFFMYVAFNAPHDPRQSPQEYIDRYPLDEMELPSNWLPEYPYQEAIGNGPSLRDEALAPFPRTAYALKK
ncbi:MAG: sulfatase-like hydrolase/transferase, partial [Bacteroidota bacterium]